MLVVVLLCTPSALWMRRLSFRSIPFLSPSLFIRPSIIITVFIIIVITTTVHIRRRSLSFSMSTIFNVIALFMSMDLCIDRLLRRTHLLWCTSDTTNDMDRMGCGLSTVWYRYQWRCGLVQLVLGTDLHYILYHDQSIDSDIRPDLCLPVRD
jgi:hypothetical protein